MQSTATAYQLISRINGSIFFSQPLHRVDGPLVPMGPFHQHCGAIFRFQSLLSTVILGTRYSVISRRTARIPILLMNAGVLSIRNTYLQHWAALVDLALRADRSSIQNNMHTQPAAKYSMQTWDTWFVAFQPDEQIQGRIVQHRF